MGESPELHISPPLFLNLQILHSLNGCSRIRSAFAGLAGPSALPLGPRTPCLVSMGSGQCQDPGGSSACSGISTRWPEGFCSCLWPGKCSTPSLQTLQGTGLAGAGMAGTGMAGTGLAGTGLAGRRGNAVISSGRCLLAELPQCIPERCWRVPSRVPGEAAGPRLS